MTDYLINGTSLRTAVGFRPQLGTRHHGAPQENVVVLRHGRPGGFFPQSNVGVRRVPFAGILKHTTEAARLTAEDELKRLLALEDFTLTYTRSDGSSRTLTRCRQFGEPAIRPVPIVSGTIAEVGFTLETVDPYWNDSAATTVTLDTPATPENLVLGTADSDWVLTIVGAATTPSVTFKDGTGATVATLTFATVAGGSDLIIDSYRGTVELDDGGGPDNAMSTLTAGGPTWPLLLKRSWYDGSTPPTVEISAGAATSAIVYTKRYH